MPSPITITSITFNSLSVLLLTWRCTHHLRERTVSSNPFRNLMIAVLWCLLGAYFLSLGLADIFISALMVHTLVRSLNELQDSTRGTSGQGSTGQPKIVLSRDASAVGMKSFEPSPGEADVETGPTTLSKKRVNQLKLMLGLLIMANCVVFVMYTGVAALLPNNSTEVTQIAEAWASFHAVLGLAFLSEFKNSIIKRRLGPKG
ncbi:hypothetical protein HK104_001134 [Borealophlyctis nickersoniae]|nr:hypothetical protein HK104_001134 [Borealophlyctis nickersoniae]